MNAGMQLAQSAFIAAVVSVAALAVYDVSVRQPRTPRLAVIDIAKLFSAAERSAKDRLVGAARRPRGPAEGASGGSPTPGNDDLATLQATAEFGTAVERVLIEISTECRCSIVASAAVIGKTSSIPDFTEEAAHRLGVSLPQPRGAGR